MYCPSCGAESTIELNYCNRCGANLSSPFAAHNEIAPISLTKPMLIIGVVILLVTLGGLAGIVSGTIEMIRAGAGEVSAAIPIFGMPTILTIDILLLRLLSKLISATLQSKQARPVKRPTYAPGELHSARPSTARLEPAPSVTENTTRFFEPLYREPQPVEARDRKIRE